MQNLAISVPDLGMWGSDDNKHRTWKKHESACQNNWICCALNLSGAIDSAKPIFLKRSRNGCRGFPQDSRGSTITVFHSFYMMMIQQLISRTRILATSIKSLVLSSWFSILDIFAKLLLNCPLLHKFSGSLPFTYYSVTLNVTQGMTVRTPSPELSENCHFDFKLGPGPSCQRYQWHC